MGTYNKVLSLALAAASANNIAQAQTPGAAGNLTLNGSAVATGVATLDVARRVLITTASNESAKTLTITGTDRNGNVQSETMTGPNATTANTVLDYKTITQIAVSAAFTGNVSAGTSGIASSAPFIVDRFMAATNISCATVVSGTVNYSIEVAYTDLSPAWAITQSNVAWYAPNNTANLTSQTANKNDVINMPVTMVRLTQNSFTNPGTVSATINVPMVFGHG